MDSILKSVVIVLLMWPSSLVLAGVNEDVFKEANNNYDLGKYDLAIEGYKSILESGFHSAEVYFNLGNSYFQKEVLAESILNYERARKMDPSDKRIYEALSMAREKIDSEIIEVQDFILLRYWSKFSHLLKPFYWMFLQLVFGLIMIYGVYRWKFADLPSLRIRGLMTFIIALIGLSVCFLAGAKSHKMLHGKEDAIVMQDVKLMSGPDTRSEEINNILSGEKVKIVDDIDGWYKVQLLNKAFGWISVSKIEII